VKSFDYCVRIVLNVMAFAAYSAALPLFLNAIYHFPARWLIFATAVCGGILSTMCELSAARSRVGVITGSTPTVPQG
jgi:hypothetical protein